MPWDTNFKDANSSGPTLPEVEKVTAETDGRRHILERTTFLQAHFVMLLQNELYNIKFLIFFIILILLCILFSY